MRLRVVWSALILSALAGCWKAYIRVDVADTTATGATPEVSGTDAYRRRVASIRTVAIRAPDACPQGTACGPQLEALERAFANAGYRVVSWAALQGATGRTVYEASRQLGADAIIFVNAFDAPRVRAEEFNQVTLQFFASNPEGEKLGEVIARADTRELLSGVVRKRYVAADANGLSAVTASLDATVVMTDSGEAVWFYRRAQTRPIDQKPATSFLFRGRESSKPMFRLVSPRLADETHRRAVDGPLGSDAGRDAESALIRDVSQDLVQRFRSGT